MKFNSQICTSRFQSERLLALGLKKETADCYYWQETDRYGDGNGKFHLELLAENREHAKYLDECFGVCLEEDEEHYFIPAWSLHRLIEMMPMYFKETKIEIRSEAVKLAMKDGNLYDNLIDIIADCIKAGYFNNEYLEK